MLKFKSYYDYENLNLENFAFESMAKKKKAEK